MVDLKILVVCITFMAVINGQHLWQNPECKKQIQEFLECKRNIFRWKEIEERTNRSQALYAECSEKNGCLADEKDLPHDLDWRKIQCGRDVMKVVLQKVQACVRLRVSPEFEFPETFEWAYGRYCYETLPLPNEGYLQRLCKRGDLEGAKKCYKEVQNIMNITADGPRQDFYDIGCARRAKCYKGLSDECLAKHDAYRQAVCECSYDVHDLYGGKRLMLLVPTCAGFVNDKKTKFMSDIKERLSCALEDLDERDSSKAMCDLGYDKFIKQLKEKMANTTTSTSTAKPTVKMTKVETKAPIFVSDKEN